MVFLSDSTSVGHVLFAEMNLSLRVRVQEQKETTQINTIQAHAHKNKLIFNDLYLHIGLRPL